MKKDLLIIPVYIFYTLFFTVLVGIFIVLYPLPSSQIDNARIYILDVFSYSSLYSLPLVAIAALLIVTVRAIKLYTFTTLEVLLYVFLCLTVWLIITPLFIFQSPEQKVSFFITGQYFSQARVFFDFSSLPFLQQNLENYSITVSEFVFKIFSDILLLRDTALVAGKIGRFEYLLFSSLGLSLSSLYALRKTSSWKLINIAAILLLWVTIVWVNAQLYKGLFDYFFEPKWNALIFNSAVSVLVILVGLVSGTKKNKRLNASEDV